MAEEIRKRRVSSNNDASIELVQYEPIGQHWPKRFLGRHPDLESVYARRIEAACMKESTPEAIKEWFDTFEKVMRDYNVRPENIYNMDEMGFYIGSAQ